MGINAKSAKKVTFARSERCPRGQGAALNLLLTSPLRHPKLKPRSIDRARAKMISIFNVLAAWTRDAAFMKSQPGYMDAAASRYRQQHNLHELRAVGKRGGIQNRLRKSRIPAPHYGLSAKRRFTATSVPQGIRAWDPRFRLSRGEHHDRPCGIFGIRLCPRQSFL